MSDNSSLVHNHRGVSSDVLYNFKPSCINCRSYRCSIPSTNGGGPFNPSSMIIYYIPARRNCFLDPQQAYLKMTIRNNDTTASQYFNLYGSGACVIQRVDIYSGSNLVETAQQYNVFMSAISYLNMNVAARSGASPMYGTSDVSTSVYSSRMGSQINHGNRFTFCIPLISGLVGMLAEKCTFLA